MTRTISLDQACAQLSDLVRALGADDEIILTDNDKQIARILTISAGPKRIAGAWKGVLTVVKEDDEHLEDFKNYMP